MMFASALHPAGRLVLVLQLREVQLHLLGAVPAGQGVRQEDGGSVLGVGCGAGLGQQVEELELGDHEWSGQNLEADNAAADGFQELGAQYVFVAAGSNVGGDATDDFQKIGGGSAAGVQDYDPRIGEAPCTAQLFPEKAIHLVDLIADDLRRRVPDTQLFSEIGVERLEEGFIEVGEGGGRTNISAVGALEERGIREA